MPQDRVCEFAKLNPIQLLEETEKAVGDPELPVKHRALVEKNFELKKHENVRKNYILSSNIFNFMTIESALAFHFIRFRLLKEMEKH